MRRTSSRDVLVVHHERRRHRRIEDLELVGQHLDLAALQVRRSPCLRGGGAPGPSRAARTRCARGRRWRRSRRGRDRRPPAPGPSRSRRSMKITPPWSRRRWAQPKSVTVCPRNRVSVLPQYSVRMRVTSASRSAPVRVAWIGRSVPRRRLRSRRRRDRGRSRRVLSGRCGARLRDAHGDDVLERRRRRSSRARSSPSAAR